MPLFLRCFFLCCFFLCHRLIPPFHPQRAEHCEELGMTSLCAFSNHHIFFVKLFVANFQRFSPARAQDFFLTSAKSSSFHHYETESATHFRRSPLRYARRSRR